MKIALTRTISPRIADCELSFLPRVPIDVVRAQAQHANYERALEDAGYSLRRLPDAPDLPDAVFVEDTAVVLEEVAVITRPGATSRRMETESTASMLAEYRPLLRIESGTLDGGDVLRVGRKLYVGLSARSDRAAIDELVTLLQPFGYETVGVRLDGCLHLKSAVTQIDDETLLLNPDWVDPRHFTAMRTIPVDPAEPHAANSLWLGETVVYPASQPKTCARLEARGVRLTCIDMSETEKAEGGVTCCSLLFDV
ncbi:MAG TPA: arginine deiminase family protein [Gammaproteobacteria bacterium]|nr:arginine deiminase family protein [Gammaproteobacteria bacterium]